MAVLINDIVDRVGGRTELAGAEGVPPAGRCERALNDALQEVALTYKIPQFEADPSWTFASNIYQTGTASNSALGVTITGTATAWLTAVNATVGWLFKYNSDSTWSEIISIASDTSMVVSPRITGAHTNAAYAIVQNYFIAPQMSGGQTGAVPEDVYSIVDVRELEGQRRLEPVDIRRIDRTYWTTGNPVNYSPWKNGIFLWPPPDVANIYYRVRYIQRPQYKASGNKTLEPLPEEWQEVVASLALSKVLASLMEFERASAARTFAEVKAEKLMNVQAEQSEDNRVRLKPDPIYLANATGR